MTPKQVAAQMIARIDAGFQNEHHWMNWRRSNSRAIEALPIGLRNRVLMHWEQASTPEFSRKAR